MATSDDSAPASGDPTESLTDEEAQARLDALDLDDDGKVSMIEAERAQLGAVDARLEELAEQGGITGALAKGAHKIVDQLDND